MFFGFIFFPEDITGKLKENEYQTQKKITNYTAPDTESQWTWDVLLKRPNQEKLQYNIKARVAWWESDRFLIWQGGGLEGLRPTSFPDATARGPAFNLSSQEIMPTAQNNAKDNAKAAKPSYPHGLVLLPQVP